MPSQWRAGCRSWNAADAATSPRSRSSWPAAAAPSATGSLGDAFPAPEPCWSAPTGGARTPARRSIHRARNVGVLPRADRQTAVAHLRRMWLREISFAVPAQGYRCRHSQGGKYLRCLHTIHSPAEYFQRRAYGSEESSRDRLEDLCANGSAPRRESSLTVELTITCDSMGSRSDGARYITSRSSIGNRPARCNSMFATLFFLATRSQSRCLGASTTPLSRASTTRQNSLCRDRERFAG